MRSGRRLLGLVGLALSACGGALADGEESTAGGSSSSAFSTNARGSGGAMAGLGGSSATGGSTTGGATTGTAVPVQITLVNQSFIPLYLSEYVSAYDFMGCADPNGISCAPFSPPCYVSCSTSDTPFACGYISCELNYKVRVLPANESYTFTWDGGLRGTDYSACTDGNSCLRITPAEAGTYEITATAYTGHTCGTGCTELEENVLYLDEVTGASQIVGVPLNVPSDDAITLSFQSFI